MTSLTEDQRFKLFDTIKGATDEETAQAVMSNIPTSELDTPATKDFVRAQVSDVRAQVSDVRAEVSDLRASFWKALVLVTGILVAWQGVTTGFLYQALSSAS